MQKNLNCPELTQQLIDSIGHYMSNPRILDIGSLEDAFSIHGVDAETVHLWRDKARFMWGLTRGELAHKTNLDRLSMMLFVRIGHYWPHLVKEWDTPTTDSWSGYLPGIGRMACKYLGGNQGITIHNRLVAIVSSYHNKEAFIFSPKGGNAVDIVYSRNNKSVVATSYISETIRIESDKNDYLCLVEAKAKRS